MQAGRQGPSDQTKPIIKADGVKCYNLPVVLSCMYPRRLTASILRKAWFTACQVVARYSLEAPWTASSSICPVGYDLTWRASDWKN